MNTAQRIRLNRISFFPGTTTSPTIIAAELRAKCIPNLGLLTNQVGRRLRITTNYFFFPKSAFRAIAFSAIRNRPHHQYPIKQLETGEFVDLAFYNGLQPPFEIAELL